MKSKIIQSIEIHASRDAVWQALTSPDTFKEWCSAFAPGSYYEGDWTEGSSMRFLAPGESGQVAGMLSKIARHVPGELIRCEHYGVVENGTDIFEGPDYDVLIPAIEEYRLSEGNGTLTLTVETQVPPSYVEFFSVAWQSALAKIKDLAESL